MKHLKLYEGFWSDRKKRRQANQAITKAESELNKHISHLIGKKYGFQYSVYIWTSKSSNYQEIDHDKLTFKGIELEPTFYDSDIANGAFFYLIFTDKNNDNVSIYFNLNSSTQNEIDLEYDKPWDVVKKSLRGTITDKEEDLDSINYDDVNRYPNRDDTINYVPSEYSTIEMLGELKGLLQSINDQIKSIS